MVKGLYTAHTGMVNEMKRLDILANNLANADTTAYKKEGTTSRTFADEMSLRIKDSSNMGIPKKLGDITYGVHLGQVYTDYSTGNFKVTDNTTDFAIEGNGFFAVAFTDKQGNTSVKYTRDGAFTVNKEGYLVTKDGDYVLNATGAMNGDPGQNNYIRLDPNAAITVNKWDTSCRITRLSERSAWWMWIIMTILKNTVRICITFFREETGLQQIQYRAGHTGDLQCKCCK